MAILFELILMKINITKANILDPVKENVIIEYNVLLSEDIDNPENNIYKKTQIILSKEDIVELILKR